MDLRPATHHDLPDIAALHLRNWQRDYAHILPELVLGSRLAEEMAVHWRREALALGRVFVARAPETDMLLGFAAMLDQGAGAHAFLESLHVAPEARAQGVGRALMVAVAVVAMPGGLELEVLAENRAARQIYRKWGGQERLDFEEEILGYKVPAVQVLWPDAEALCDRLRGRL